MLLEYISKFYRTLVSTPPWFRYLSNAHNSGAVFAVIITAVYLMVKGGVIFSRLRELFRAFVNFLQDPVSIYNFECFCHFLCVSLNKVLNLALVFPADKELGQGQGVNSYCGLDGTGPCKTGTDRTSSVVGALVGRVLVTSLT